MHVDRPSLTHGARSLALLAAAILVVGIGAIRLTPHGSDIAVWWPASGFTVAVAIRLGRRLLPGVALVTWVGCLLAGLIGQRDQWLSLSYATASLVEVLVVCTLAWLVCDLNVVSGRALSSLTGAAVAGSVAAAFVVAVSVSMLGTASFWGSFLAVAASHFSAIVLFLPFVLPQTRRSSNAGLAEILVTAIVLGGVGAFIFSSTQSLPVIFLLFPLLAAVSFGQSLRACAAQLILVNSVAIVLSVHGWGPIALAVRRADMQSQMTSTLLQTLVISTAAMVFALRLTVESKFDALAAATQARRHLSAVIHGATATAIIETDLAGVIQMFSQGAENLLGYSAEEIVGRHSPLLFTDPAEVEERAATLGVEPGFEVFTASLNTGATSVERGDWTYITADGSRRLVQLVISRISDDEDNPIGYVGIAQDVGAQRRVETLLVQALEHERSLAEQLREADLLKSDFVSSVSHELRTPMTSVLGYAEVLADEYAQTLGDQGLGILDRIQTNGNRLLALVDDLLTLSRIESGSLPMTTEPYDVCAIATRACTVIKPLAVSGAITLDARIPERAVWLDGDPREIERVFINLLGNAVKFTPEGGSVAIDVIAEASGRAIVQISDTGIGIPENERERIFERFHRGANAISSTVPGTGLGLVIVKAIIERHHGVITVDSKVGKGSTFTIYLPGTMGP